MREKSTMVFGNRVFSGADSGAADRIRYGGGRHVSDQQYQHLLSKRFEKQGETAIPFRSTLFANKIVPLKKFATT